MLVSDPESATVPRAASAASWYTRSPRQTVMSPAKARFEQKSFSSGMSTVGEIRCALTFRDYDNQVRRVSSSFQKDTYSHFQRVSV